MASLESKQFEACQALHTRNADPVTVDGKTYPPGELFFTRWSWEKTLKEDFSVVVEWYAECAPSSEIPLANMYEMLPWPMWLEFSLLRRESA